MQKMLANQIFGDARKSTQVSIGGDVEMKEESKSSDSGLKVDPKQLAIKVAQIKMLMAKLPEKRVQVALSGISKL